MSRPVDVPTPLPRAAVTDQCDLLKRWFVYDLVTQLGFGEPIGFVKQGKDVGGLIAAFHEMAPLAGVLAAVPWLLNPIFKNPIFKGFLMPRPGDSSGTGRIMAYRDQMIKARLDSRETGHGDFLDKYDP